MGPRSAWGTAQFNVAMWLAVVLFTVGASVVGPDVLAAPRPHASASEQPAPFDAGATCQGLMITLSGACPLPAKPWARRAVIYLCVESLCGRGFRPADTILLVARQADGSTFWRTRTDRNGNFQSPLPSPLCHFTPVGLAAFDDHGERSSPLSLASMGCVASKN